MFVPALLASLAFAAPGVAAGPERFSWPQIQWEAVIEPAPGSDCAVLALAVDARDAIVVAGRVGRASGIGTTSVPLVARFGPGGRRIWEANALVRPASRWGEARLAVVGESREITVFGVVGESIEDPFRVAVFTRFSPEGQILWTRTVTVDGVAGFEPVSMAAVAGGDLVVAGTGRRPDAIDVAEWCVVRFDSRLRARWFRIHDGRSSGEAVPARVVADRAGDAFVIGTGRVGLGPERWLIEGWGPKAERRMSAWGDGDPACVSQTARLLAVAGRGFLVAGDQVCTGGTSAVFVRKLGKGGETVWTAPAPTPGRAAAVLALPSGGAIVAGEERGGEESGIVTWPFAMRWNSQGDLLMSCRGLRKAETSARYAAAALDSEGNLVAAGESTVEVKGSPVRRVFVRKMRF